MIDYGICDACGKEKTIESIIQTNNLAGIAMCADCLKPRSLESKYASLKDQYNYILDKLDFLEDLLEQREFCHLVLDEYYKKYNSSIRNELGKSSKIENASRINLSLRRGK